MGNRANRMAICSRKQELPTQKLSEFTSFVEVYVDDESSTTFRPSVFDNMDKVSLEDFKILKTIGSGAFGKVHLVEKPSKIAGKKSKYYAMKVLRKEYLVAKNQCAHTMTERRILEEIESPFIVKLAFAFQTDDKLYLVLEYVAGGELFYHLKQRGHFTEKEIKFYAAEIITFLGQLHDHGVIYRDLKPENILVAKNGHLKFTDFGLSKDGMEFEDRELTYSVCGTPEYIAPEIIKQRGHGSSVDWWSLGILLYELYTGKPPVQDTVQLNVLKKIVRGNFNLSGIESASAEFQDLIASLIKVGEEDRLGSKHGAKEVMEHLFFRDINWSEVASLDLKPPFKPKVRSPHDVSNFDDHFLQ